MLHEISAALGELIFAPRCPHCDAYVERRGAWCGACAALYARPRLYLDAASPLAAVFVLTFYDGAVRRLLRRLKFERRRENLPPLEFLTERIWDDSAETGRFLSYLGGADTVVPVPLHHLREKERTFNQTDLLWREFLTARGFVWLEALARTKETRPQYELDYAARRENLKGAFAVSGAAAIKGKSVIVADDILTSGATLAECAKTLLKSGAAKVYGLALASNRPGGAVLPIQNRQDD